MTETPQDGLGDLTLQGSFNFRSTNKMDQKPYSKVDSVSRGKLEELVRRFGRAKTRSEIKMLADEHGLILNNGSPIPPHVIAQYIARAGIKKRGVTSPHIQGQQRAPDTILSILTDPYLNDRQKVSMCIGYFQA